MSPLYLARRLVCAILHHSPWPYDGDRCWRCGDRLTPTRKEPR